MAGDFNKPVNTDAYATLLQFIRENLAELAKGLDASTAANIPSGAIRFNSTTKRWEKWNGSAWSELVAKASASYDIRTTRADDIVVGASTAKARGQVGPAANSSGVSNANSYLASGLWFVVNADATTNWPEAGVGGVLQVVTSSGGDYIRQTFFIHNANKMHSRYSTNSGATWSAWKHITANADWNAASGADGFIANKPTLGDAASKNVQTSLFDPTAGRIALVGSFGFGAKSPLYSGNLNDIIYTSLYYCDGNASNRPVAQNGWVDTRVYASSGYAVQLYYPYGTRVAYMRMQENGVWKAWSSIGGAGFHATKANTQAIAAATVTKVTFDEESFDDLSCFASSRFTVTQPGKYLFGGHIRYTDILDGISCYAYIYVNGIPSGYGYVKSNGTFTNVQAQTLLELAAGDYVQLYAYAGSAGNVANGTATCFWGCRL